MGLISGLIGAFGGGPGNAYEFINPPDPETMKIKLEEYVQQGILTPEDAQTIMQNPSEFNKITTDPAFKAAQMEALTGLQDVAESGGLDANAKARLSDIARGEATKSRGAREAILSNAAERGVGGSGLEMMAALKNQQESAGRASDRDTQVAADAESRALDALVKSGVLGGQMEEQAFGEKAKIAEAQDAVNRFNTYNLNDTERANVEARNNAAAANLGAKQAVADANVSGRNREQQYNKELYQRQFENKMAKAAGEQSANNAAYNARMGAIGDIESGVSDIIGGFQGAAAKKALKKAQGGVSTA